VSRIVASLKPLEKFFVGGEPLGFADKRRLLVTIYILNGL